MALKTEDQVYGCLIGGAVGDALGAPVENWSYKQIREEHGKVDDFLAYDSAMAVGDPGTVTDDTVMRQYLSLAIIENQGRVTPDEYAEVLIQHLNPDRVWITEEITHLKLLGGVNPWEAGRSTIPTATASMHIAPVGIINARNPRQAYQDAYNIASITQDGCERKAAATVAAGVARAFSPNATIDDVLETMFNYAPDVFYRSIDLTMALADEANSIDEFVELFYEEQLDWQFLSIDWNREKYAEGEIFSGRSIEIVPISMAILDLCRGDLNDALVEAASFGRDADTIGSVVGSLGGALYGGTALHEDWRETCEEANRDLFQELHGNPDFGFERTADQLTDALVAEHKRIKNRLGKFDELVDNIDS